MKTINKIDLFLKYCLDHPKTKTKKKGDLHYNTNVKLINGIVRHNDLDMITSSSDAVYVEVKAMVD